MPNVFQVATDFLNAQLKAYASVFATMERDGQLLEAMVTLGSQMLRVTDRSGNTKVERTDRDIGIEAADHVINGLIVEPQAGDNWYIDLDDGAGILQYEVMSPNNEGPWRYSDSHRKRLRIHTKFVGAVDSIFVANAIAGNDAAFAGSSIEYAGAE